VIAVQDLRKTYDLDHGSNVVEALRGVSLVVRAGEFLAVMGASGSGKSTLLNVLGCLDRPTAGQYLLDGEDVGRLDADRRAELRNAKIGFVFQSFNLLPRTTARENVELPLVYGTAPIAEHRGRAEAALRAVGLGDAAGRLPNELSGGQQQRVAIARALVNEPDIVFADEPTGNLDTETSREVVGLMKRLHKEKGLTFIIVTHDAAVGNQTERVILMRNGVILKSVHPTTT